MPAALQARAERRQGLERHRAGTVCYTARMDLQGKRIVLGVTGGVAAYKAAELVRLGVDRVVVSTDSVSEAYV